MNVSSERNVKNVASLYVFCVGLQRVDMLVQLIIPRVTPDFLVYFVALCIKILMIERCTIL